MPQSNCVAVILAGGQGSRIGGNKAMQLLHGRPLITHVLDRLIPQIERILISIGPKATSLSIETAIFSALKANDATKTPPPRPRDYVFLPDITHAEYLGPLAGIATALAWCQAQNQGSRPEYLLSVTVDTVFLPENLLSRLAEFLPDAQPVNSGADIRNPNEVPIIRARSMGRIHPAIALWPLAAKSTHSQKNLAEYIGSVQQAILQKGAKTPSLQQIQSAFACAELDFPPRPHSVEALRDPFFNINNLADLSCAEQAFIGGT